MRNTWTHHHPSRLFEEIDGWVEEYRDRRIDRYIQIYV